MIAEICQHFTRGQLNLVPDPRGAAVTIGSFDGVHLGHQAILRQVTTRASAMNLQSVAMVFEPLPQEFFLGEKAPARLMRLREKAQALLDAGIDKVVCLRFTESFRHLPVEAFIEDILLDGLNTRYLVVGDDFRFGRDRAGDIDVLRRMQHQCGFEVTDTDTYEIDGERVSSTRIRRELELGHFAKAAELLGKPYSISGKVVYGQQLGRQIGIPTANVALKRHRSPVAGVFAVEAIVAGQRYRGVANVGVKPTVAEGIKPLLEVHLLDFSGDLYGQRMSVEFRCKLRDEARFASFEALKTQIHQDIADARQFFQRDIPDAQC